MDTTIATPLGTVTIRTAKEEDAAAYRELRLEALHNHPAAFSSDYESQRDKPPSFWAERLKPGSGLRFWFAVHQGQLIGMCGIARADSPKLRHSADIISMYVRPDWRGCHIGEGLVNAGVEWATAAGVRIVKLAVVANNVSAIRCYARCGFQVYGVEPQALYHDGAYYDELLMARNLS